MKNLYCIAGLGADEKVFSNLDISGYRLCYLPWLRPLKNEMLASYASRMRDEISEDAPVIMGLSFGGMIATEMLKQGSVSKVILVSAPKIFTEIPLWMRIGGKLKLHKIIPLRSRRFTEKRDNRRMGVITEEEKVLVRGYRKNADPYFIGWAVHQILTWKNRDVPAGLFQVHGDADRMFPAIKDPTQIISGGTHMMILNRAKDVSACIERILSRDTEENSQ